LRGKAIEIIHWCIRWNHGQFHKGSQESHVNSSLNQNQFKLDSSLRPHPNVVAVLGICTQMDKMMWLVTGNHSYLILCNLYIFIEYLEDGNLLELINSKWPFKEETVLSMAMDIAAGMYHIHVSCIYCTFVL
jgi:serine/threonine protein kinase